MLWNLLPTTPKVTPPTPRLNSSWDDNRTCARRNGWKIAANADCFRLFSRCKSFLHRLLCVQWLGWPSWVPIATLRALSRCWRVPLPQSYWLFFLVFQSISILSVLKAAKLRLCRCALCRPQVGQWPKFSWLSGRMAAVFQRLRAVADVVGLGLHRCALRFRCCVDHHLGISLCRWATATRMKSAACGVTLYLAMGKFDEIWIWHPGDHRNIQLVNDGKWTIAKSFLEKPSHIPYSHRYWFIHMWVRAMCIQRSSLWTA